MHILCLVGGKVQEVDVSIDKGGHQAPLFDRVFSINYQVIRFYQDSFLSSVFVPTLRICLPL